MIDVSLLPSLARERSNFINLVRDYNNGEVFDRFKQILQDHIEQRKDYVETCSNIDELFHDHIQLAQEFHDYRKLLKLAVYHAKVGDRLAINDNPCYLAYFEIIQGFRSGQKSMKKMVEELAILFVGHMDLLLEFCEFLPRDHFDFDG